MSLVALYGTLVKAAQDMPHLLGTPGTLPAPHRRGLHAEKRTDKVGRTQTRWLQNTVLTRPPGPRGPITSLDRARGLRGEQGAAHAAPGVIYMVSTNSSLTGRAGKLGVMVNARTTGIHQGVKEGHPWGMDNGAYSGQFHPETFMGALEKMQGYTSNCRFAVAPDVLGDGPATEALLETWRAPMRELGYPVAFVFHRGTTRLPDCDCLFIPASNLDDPMLPNLVAQAHSMGLWVHLGRVNSAQRMRLAADLQVDSADGTHVKYAGLDAGTAEIAGWTAGTEERMRQPQLLSPTRAAPTESRVQGWNQAGLRDHARRYGEGGEPLSPRQMVGLPERRTP